MNVNTSEWQALNAKVKQQRKETALLIRAMALLVSRRAEEFPEAAGTERLQLRVIKGGRS